MRYFPSEDEYDKELKDYAAEPWMVEQLKRNWDYVAWGPHEDYQWISDLSNPNSPRKFPTWASFRKGFTPGKHPEVPQDRSGGEIVGWYFNVARERRECTKCEGSGLNAESRRIHDDWYDFNRTGRRWCNNITQDEVDALIEAGRLNSSMTVYTRQGLDRLVEDGRITAERAEELWEGRDKSKDQEFDNDDGVTKRLRVYIPWRDTVPVEEFNRGHNHDAINRWICVETRCKRLGVWGTCDACEGHGYVPVDLKGRLQLVLWVVNPMTGQNYGLEIDNIEQDELEDVYDFLGGMQRRLVSRLDMPEATTSKGLKSFGSGESMMWTQAGSALEVSDAGWRSEIIISSWEDFCWPTHYKFGNHDDGDRVPKDHPKFAELYTGKPDLELNDLNELIGVRFGYDPHGTSIERLHLWLALPRKGCSRRITINKVTEDDLPGIREWVLTGRERARARLDPSMREVD